MREGDDKWTADNEVLALWLYDCFRRNADMQRDKAKYIADAAAISGLKPGSFGMKLSNIAFLEKENYGKISGGFTVLATASELNRTVFRELFEQKAELRRKAEAVIAAAPAEYFLEKNRLKQLLAG